MVMQIYVTKQLHFLILNFPCLNLFFLAMGIISHSHLHSITASKKLLTEAKLQFRLDLQDILEQMGFIVSPWPESEWITESCNDWDVGSNCLLIFFWPFEAESTFDFFIIHWRKVTDLICDSVQFCC